MFRELEIDFNEPIRHVEKPEEPVLRDPTFFEEIAKRAVPHIQNQDSEISRDDTPGVSVALNLETFNQLFPAHKAVDIAHAVDGRRLSIHEDGVGPVTEVLRMNGLDFPVRLSEIQLVNGDFSPNMDDFRAVVGPSGRVYGQIVTKSYNIVQNTTVASMLDHLVKDKSQVKITSFNHGERVGFAIQLPIPEGPDSNLFSEEIRDKRAQYKRVHNEAAEREYVSPVEYKLLVINGHGYKSSFETRLECRFKACDNGLFLNLKKQGVRFRHSRKLDNRVEALDRIFSTAVEASHTQQAMFDKMFAKKITAVEFDAFVDTMFPVSDELKRKSHIEEQRESFKTIYEMAPGAAPNTAFGLLQAATYWTTHEARVKVGGQSANRFQLGLNDESMRRMARLESSIFGSNVAFNNQAYQYVYNLV